MCELAPLFVQRGQRPGRAAGGGNPPENAVNVQCGDNVVIVAPTRGTADRVRVAQRHGRAALHRDLLELALGEEGYPLAIRRKEGRVRTLRAGERRDLTLVEAACSQAVLGIRATHHDGEARAVGRDSQDGAAGPLHRDIRPQLSAEADHWVGQRGTSVAVKAVEEHGGDCERDGESRHDPRPRPPGGSQLQRALEQRHRIADVAQALFPIFHQAAPQKRLHFRRDRAPVWLFL